jgi:monofunctional biosynthetic peptidoglycan transglycosylase
MAKAAAKPHNPHPQSAARQTGRPKASKPSAGPHGRGGGLMRFLRRLAVGLLIVLIAGPPLAVAVYRFAPPPITILMVERLIQGQGLDHRWVPISRIAPAMTRAVVASEDARFCLHHGFDFNAIQKAVAHNQAKPGRIRGGSTVSQQTAKNVFLWPERSWVRKGLEAYFTVLIELVWGKQRIMEVYLNTVEMGPGVYGVEAASQRYFHHDAHSLNPAEASRLAAILPNPLKWNAGDPGPYVRRRTGRIDARSSTVSRDGLATCVLD